MSCKAIIDFLSTYGLKEVLYKKGMTRRRNREIAQGSSLEGTEIKKPFKTGREISFVSLLSLEPFYGLNPLKIAERLRTYLKVKKEIKR